MRILLLLTILLLISCENFAQHQKIYRNNVIVVINTDAQSKRFPEIYEHAVDYLNTVLFTGKLNSKSGNHKLIFGGGLEPLVDFRKNDKLTLYTFGVNEPIPELKGKNYLDHFSEKYFKKVAIKDQKDFSDEFKSIVSKNNCRYTAQEYMQSLLMRDVSKQNIYAEKTYILYFNTPQLYFVTRQINLLVPPAKIATFDDLTSVFNNSFQRVNRLRLEMIQPYNQGGAILQHPMEIRLEEILPGSALSFQMNLLNSSFYSGSTGVELGELQLKINGIGNDIKLEELKLLYGEVAEDYDYSIDNHGFQNVELSLSVLDFTSDPVVLSDLTGTEGNFYLQSELLLRLEPVTANKYDLSVGFIIKSNELGPVQFAPPPSPIPSWVWFIVLAVVIVVIVTYYIKRDLEFETSPNKLTEIPSFEKATYFFEITYKNVGWFKKLINSKLKLQIKSDNFDIDKSGSLLINESEYKKDQVFKVKVKGETKVTFTFTFYDPQKFIDKNIAFTIKTKYNVLFLNKDINDINFKFNLQKIQLNPKFDTENPVFNDFDEDISYLDENRTAILPQKYSGVLKLKLILNIQTCQYTLNHSGTKVPVKLENCPDFISLSEDKKMTENSSHNLEDDLILFYDPKNLTNNHEHESKIDIKFLGNAFCVGSEICLNYKIKPDYGDRWVAIDPGTTGSTVVGYDGENFSFLSNTPAKKIVPSIIVYDCDKEQIPKIGHDAINYISSGYPVFMSLKKLVGVNSGIKIQHRDYKYEISAPEATTKFIELLLNAFSDNNSNYPLTNLILCVPNTFTENKIKKFKDLIPSNINGHEIKRKRHIYESEAVIINWLKGIKEFESKGCSIMVCDLGGGTINVTVAEVKKIENKFEISLSSRFGAAKGGEEITRYIADFIWQELSNKEEELKKIDPVNKTIDENINNLTAQNILNEYENKFLDLKSTLRNLKLKLFESAEKIKIWFSETKQTVASNQPFEFNAPEFVREITKKKKIIIDSVDTSQVNQEDYIKITFSKNKFVKLLEGETNSDRYKSVLKDLIKDSLTLISERSIDKLLITGRSAFTLSIKDTIIDEVKNHNTSINNFAHELLEMGIDESKLCVAKGAAIYASKPTEYKLSRNKSLANYCLFYNKANKDEFYPVIKINEEFKEIPNRKEKIIKYSGNHFDLTGVSKLKIIQVLGNIENPPKHKITTITKIKNEYISGKADVIFILSDKDRIEWKIDSETATLNGEDLFEINELYEFEENSIWHLK